MLTRIVAAAVCLAVASLSSGLAAQQQCVSYRLVPQTTFKNVPENVTCLVNETSLANETITTYRPVWVNETRQRTTVTFKPVTTTSEREERILVTHPYTVTSYREREIQETTMETVTEMREDRYLVEKPVIETQMRKEQVRVQRPVTTTVMQTENLTTYKPTTVTETQFVPSAQLQNDLRWETGRNRLRWLAPGYYVNPATGVAEFRNRGLHWVADNDLVLQQSIQPTVTPQQIETTTYVPETVQVQKPVQVTRLVDQVETREVPVQVAKTVQSIEVVKYPVTVQKPVTRTRTERIPYTETKYRQEIVVQKIAVPETKMQRIETKEPYQVRVRKWVAQQQTVQVPKTVTRRVDRVVNRLVPQTQWIQVAVDQWGNVISSMPVDSGPQNRVIASTLQKPLTQDNSPLSLDNQNLNVVRSSTLAQRNSVASGRTTFRKLSDNEYNQLRKTLKVTNQWESTTAQRKSLDSTNTVPIRPSESSTSKNSDSSESEKASGPTQEENVDTQSNSKKPAADQIPTIKIPPPSTPDFKQQPKLKIDNGADIEKRPTVNDVDTRP